MVGRAGLRSGTVAADRVGSSASRPLGVSLRGAREGGYELSKEDRRVNTPRGWEVDKLGRDVSERGTEGVCGMVRGGPSGPSEDARPLGTLQELEQGNFEPWAMVDRYISGGSQVAPLRALWRRFRGRRRAAGTLVPSSMASGGNGIGTLTG